MREADSVSIPAIVLAAGASSRLGQPKQLLRLPDAAETLLERALRLAKEAGAAPVFAVLGAHAETIQSAVNFADATVLMNSDWAEGMASSLRLGIAAASALSPPVSGALLMVCDQPAVSLNHLSKLLTIHRNDPMTIAASFYAHRCGVPAVVPRALFPELLALTGDQGARAIFGRDEGNIRQIELASGDWDIDTAEDLRANDAIRD